MHNAVSANYSNNFTPFNAFSSPTTLTNYIINLVYLGGLPNLAFSYDRLVNRYPTLTNPHSRLNLTNLTKQHISSIDNVLIEGKVPSNLRILPGRLVNRGVLSWPIDLSLAANFNKRHIWLARFGSDLVFHRTPTRTFVLSYLSVLNHEPSDAFQTSTTDKMADFSHYLYGSITTSNVNYSKNVSILSLGYTVDWLYTLIPTKGLFLKHNNLGGLVKTPISSLVTNKVGSLASARTLKPKILKLNSKLLRKTLNRNRRSRKKLPNRRLKVYLDYAYSKLVKRLNKHVISNIQVASSSDLFFNLTNLYHTPSNTALTTLPTTSHFRLVSNSVKVSTKWGNKLTNLINSNSVKYLFNNNFYLQFVLNPSYFKNLNTLNNNHYVPSHTYLYDFTNLLRRSLINNGRLPHKVSNLVKGSSTNLIPSSAFSTFRFKKALTTSVESTFYPVVEKWVSNIPLRFLESLFGQKTLIQFYPFLAKSVDESFVIRYLRWLPRMSYYERRLGHRFFLEEAIHIMHIGFFYKDSKIISRWLKAIILRISFWKTRFIFRFIRYIFINFFRYMFKSLNVKGVKIKLKGKISVGGNSRKRTILFRCGKGSYSTVNLRVLYTSDTIDTFTGIMGFQLWIFY